MASAIRRYLNETRRPVYSGALVLPFFLVYHVGTFILRTTYINGADALIMQLLALLSVRSAFASALVLLLSFVIWQVRSDSSWKVSPAKLSAMFGESLLFALALCSGFGWLGSRLSCAADAGTQAGLFERLVLYCGAGIYEELVFRGFLLSLLIIALSRLAGLRKRTAAFWGAIAAALLFSAFHYVGPTGDKFSLGSFSQRAAGGLYFSCLFVTRGFGITAATHALYDMIVGLP
ncbi:MAG: CPBP family intramembrane metalloprotease [Acidobacteria bacterium]|nr:CPBP family intramembrane metalloprotease [Acidobacteriota bacterium]